MNRCGWCCDNELAMKYHDQEWGVPLHDDKKQFEFISMEVMQCGLSWNLMLKKREIFRECFADFDYTAISKFNEQDIERILATDGMIKSRRKIEAIISNAKAFINIIDEFGSFDKYIWAFSDNKTLVYPKHHKGEWVASNELSDGLSKDLRKRGFKYLGSITVYSHLQACGIINDHAPDCFMYDKLIKLGNIKYTD